MYKCKTPSILWAKARINSIMRKESIPPYISGKSIPDQDKRLLRLPSVWNRNETLTYALALYFASFYIPYVISVWN